MKNENQSALTVIRRVTPYLWGQTPEMKIRIVLSMISLGLAQLFTVITPYFYGAIVDKLSPDTSNTAAWLGFSAMALVIIYGLTRILGVVFNQARDFIFAKVAQSALRHLALETFNHIHALSMRYHLTRKTGAMIRIIERGVKGLEFLLRFLLFSIGPLVLQISIVLFIFLFEFGWQYSLVLFITIFIYCVFTFYLTELRVKIRKEMNEADQKANQRALDSLLNYETVKYFSAEAREAARYDKAMEGYQKASILTANTLAYLNAGQSIIITTGSVVIMLFAVNAVMAGVISVGAFVALNSWMLQILQPLNFLGTVYREIRQALVDMGEMFTLLEQDPEIQDVPNAPALNVTSGNVEFRDIEFSYDGKRTILKDFNLTIPSGATIAVVGPSGSGKSTLSRLLYRFYDPQGGAVLIDDQDIKTVSQTSLREHIGIVPQDTVLYNDTIFYNIAYGNPDASAEQVYEAAKAANIHEFVLSLPDGYQTEVGERGLKLSGGEKQRVGIARTMLKNPPILILDEATSALDTTTERHIMEALEKMSTGRTVLTIAHRLSTVVNADEIIILVEGKIAERGTHEQLLEQNGRYKAMWQEQQAQEKEEAQREA